MKSRIKAIMSATALTVLLAGCTPVYSDPLQATAAAWLSRGDAGDDCPPTERATSPMRADLELAEPEYRFTGEDGAERWQVRATGDGFDRWIVIRDGGDGQLCVVADTTSR